MLGIIYFFDFFETVELPYSDIHDVLSADPTELFTNYVEPIVKKYIGDEPSYIANDCDVYECKDGVIIEFEILKYNSISYSIYRPKLMIGGSPVSLLKQLYEGACGCKRWGIWENHSQP